MQYVNSEHVDDLEAAKMYVSYITQWACYANLMHLFIYFPQEALFFIIQTTVLFVCEPAKVAQLAASQ